MSMLYLLGGFHLADVDRHSRSFAPEPAQDLGQDAANGRANHADHQQAGFALSDAGCFPEGLIELIEDTRRPFAENLTGGGKAHTPVCAVDKLRELGFELLDLMAERRLRDVQQQRGAAVYWRDLGYIC